MKFQTFLEISIKLKGNPTSYIFSTLFAKKLFTKDVLCVFVWESSICMGVLPHFPLVCLIGKMITIF